MYPKNENYELKNAKIKIKNSLQGLNGQMEITKEKASEFEDRAAELIQYEQKRTKELKNDHIS